MFSAGFEKNTSMLLENIEAEVTLMQYTPNVLRLLWTLFVTVFNQI